MQICETSSELCFTFVPFLHTCMLWFNNIPWEKNCALFFFHHSDFWLPFQCAHSLYLTFDIFLPSFILSSPVFINLSYPHTWANFVTSVMYLFYVYNLSIIHCLAICYCSSFLILLSLCYAFSLCAVHFFSLCVLLPSILSCALDLCFCLFLSFLPLCALPLSCLPPLWALSFPFCLSFLLLSLPQSSSRRWTRATQLASQAHCHAFHWMMRMILS